jgi:hypothetical protein
MKAFTCTECGSHDHTDFYGPKGKITMVCRACAQKPKIPKPRKPRRCPVCRERGHYSNFHQPFVCKNCGSKDSKVYTDNYGRHRKCLPCSRIHAKESHKRNYKPHPRVRHSSNELRKRRLEKVLEGRPLECAICHEKLEVNRYAHIDHDHKTGKIRGVLCMYCNHGLGSFRDSKVFLRRAIQYLKVFSE